MISTPLSCPCLVKKTSILSKLHIITKKVNRMSFFSDISRKKFALMLIYFQKKTSIIQKNTASCPYFVEKTSILSETLCSYVNFFKIFIKNPLLSCPYLIKNINSNKVHYNMSQKSQYDAHFFRFLTEKSSLSCPYFVKKRPFSKKHAALKSRFCQKNGHSLKNTVLLCHFFKIFMTNPLLSRPYLVKKTSILSK